MKKEELFSKYNINESHNVWDNGIDSWMSVELFRIMHDRLPIDTDTSSLWACNFLDKVKNDVTMAKLPNFGSLYLTAKRIICTNADDILKEINHE